MQPSQGCQAAKDPSKTRWGCTRVWKNNCHPPLHQNVQFFPRNAIVYGGFITPAGPTVYPGSPSIGYKSILNSLSSIQFTLYCRSGEVRTGEASLLSVFLPLSLKNIIMQKYSTKTTRCHQKHKLFFDILDVKTYA